MMLSSKFLEAFRNSSSFSFEVQISTQHIWCNEEFDENEGTDDDGDHVHVGGILLSNQLSLRWNFDVHISSGFVCYQSGELFEEWAVFRSIRHFRVKTIKVDLLLQRSQ